MESCIIHAQIAVKLWDEISEVLNMKEKSEKTHNCYMPAHWLW